MKYLSTFLLFSIVFAACTKNNPHLPNTPKDAETLLSNHVWQIKHIHSLQNNIVYFYERGGSNNTYNYDNDYLKFNKDGSGTYTAGNDVYEIDWQFDNADKFELSYTIHGYANGQPAPGEDHEMKLENVVVTENSFRYAELYTNANGDRTVSSVYREPKPESASVK